MMTDDQEERERALLKVVAARCFAREDAKPAEVLQGLFVGSVGAAKNVNVLVERGVTHVLNASPVVPCFHKQRLKYKVLEVYDDADEDIAQFFEESNRFIDRALQKRKGGVLVHCYAGQSRSPTLVIAYLLSRKCMSLSDALRWVRQVRPATRPNHGFLRQLEAYAESLGLSPPAPHHCVSPCLEPGASEYVAANDECDSPCSAVLDRVLTKHCLNGGGSQNARSALEISLLRDQLMHMELSQQHSASEGRSD